MDTLTLTKPEVAPETTVMPELDTTEADAMADAMLLDAVKRNRVGTVKRPSGAAGRIVVQSRESRAWTMGGRVD